MSDFVFVETPSVAAAGAETDALAGTTMAAAGTASAAGATVPPGLEETSLANVARIGEHVANVVSAIGLGSATQGEYGVSLTTAAAGYEARDAAEALRMAIGG